MKYIVEDDKIFISLERGDFINASLTEIAKKENLSSGWINGIGALENAELGYYDYPTKTYIKKQFNDEFELTSLSGNISIKDNDVFVHTHVTISRMSFEVFGGHLFDAQISAAGEFVIFSGSSKIQRKLNNDIGLALWCLGESNA